MRKENKIISVFVLCALLVLGALVMMSCDRPVKDAPMTSVSTKVDSAADLLADAEMDRVEKVSGSDLNDFVSSGTDAITDENTDADIADNSENELAVPSDTRNDNETVATDNTVEDTETELKHGSKGSKVKKLQSRLVELGYLSEAVDGAYGKNTEKAVKMFQRDAGLAETGVADEATQSLLYSDAAPTAPVTYDHEDVLNPNYSADYYIIVYTDSYNVLVLGKDDYGKYNQVVKNFACSVGKGGDDITPEGLYKVEVRYDWRAMFGGVYAQYAVRFYGNYLFHSVPYYSESADDLEMEEFEKLGSPASLGCVRLCVRDAKWIYDNASNGTQVRILDGKDGPSDTESIPALIYDDEHYGWDPTDPNSNNPYNK